ncbi:hypothetical protein HCU74_05215 [Spongiibacter sp. KMU-166]|uniref:Chromosome partition protein Smc n=1 Tax=Spongiibacter thalassae TaxID=2721624 RepID=A0ABX1GEE9_9GAMM|nr:hypothetical protein [Spongiibacter thalassae]NKI16818.1 hypothetical protein [Spongiibacter thalassae]
MGAVTEAIVFFDDDVVVKEMYFAEFEAVLDDVVGISDFAGRDVQAVFVQISSSLKLLGAVFFAISFDSRGRIAGHWNLPLRHLLDHAGLGPDLGAGPIKVACRSACPVSWYRSHLWDPEMNDNHSFDQLCAAIARNRLGIISDMPVGSVAGNVSPFFSVPPSPAPAMGRQHSPTANDPGAAAKPSPGPVFHRRYRARLTAIRHAEKLRLATVNEAHLNQISVQEDRHNRKLAERDEQITQLKAELARSSKEVRALKLRVTQQHEQLAEAKRELEARIEKGGQDYRAQLEQFKLRYEHELADRLAEERRLAEEQIRRRDEQLYQRSTEIVDLRAELSRVRDQNEELLLSDDGKLLREMSEKGVVYVAYHPGIEHLLIAPEEMPVYLRNPVAFAAQRCGVDTKHYQRWLSHYRLPICQALGADGEVCGVPVRKIMRPHLYTFGESDRCEEHGSAAK